jgi:hypothetical protein
VKFVAKPGKQIGEIYEVRLVKPSKLKIGDWINKVEKVIK